MKHYDLVAGRMVELRPHRHSPWERWKVCRLAFDWVELEREIPLDYARECLGDTAVDEAIREAIAGGTAVAAAVAVTVRLLAVRLPSGRLTDDVGHNIEMREVAS